MEYTHILELAVLLSLIAFNLLVLGVRRFKIPLFQIVLGISTVIIPFTLEVGAGGPIFIVLIVFIGIIQVADAIRRVF